MNLKQALEGKMPEEDLKHVYRSFEVLGDIAIIQVPEQIEKHKMLIAETLSSLHNNIKVVLRKYDDISGKYRVGNYEILIGDRTDTIYRENNIRLKVDPSRSYFSAKLSTERERITSQIKDGERIVCMFAGLGPFPINVAKKHDVTIDAVEINPEATKLFEENLGLNKLKGDISIHTGDVGVIVPNLEGSYDRVMMPAPKDAIDFLDMALDKVKTEGIINYYGFVPSEDYDNVPVFLKEKCKDLGHSIDVLEVRKCGNVGICQIRFAADLKVLD